MAVLKTDFLPIGAVSAEKALIIIKSQTVDLILMDISLKGGMNGLELTKRLRESKEYSKIPIIAVTGHASVDDQKRCIDGGCNEVLIKPFLVSNLFEKMKMFVK